MEVGVQCGTAYILRALLKKTKSMGRKKATELLRLVHPRVMENVRVTAGWNFVPISRRYEWRRRAGWHVRKGKGKWDR